MASSIYIRRRRPSCSDLFIMAVKCAPLSLTASLGLEGWTLFPGDYHLDMPLDVFQYSGVALGLIGAILVSQRSAQHRRWGFLLWIGSNVLLISWTIGAAAWGLLAMYAVYSVTSIMGWRNNRDPEAKPA